MNHISPAISNSSSDKLLNNLSEREEQIVKQIVTGSSSKDIAQNLNISMETVKTHRKNIHRKLQTHSVIQLILKTEELSLF
jgi:FixJ family two-component response regulator